MTPMSEKLRRSCDAGLDGRCRDEYGEIRRKRSDTLVGTLRNEYGHDFASGFRGDVKLETVLRETKSASLSDYLKRRQPVPGRRATARDTAKALGVSLTRAHKLINTVSGFAYRDGSGSLGTTRGTYRDSSTGSFVAKKKSGRTNAKTRVTKTKANDSAAHR